MNGAVSSTAAFAALSATASPDDLRTLLERSLPSRPILNKSTTLLLSLPFGGSQFIFMRLCSSLMYGPKSGSLTASIPGAPLGFPGPGLPTLPLLPLLPEEENLPPELLPLGAKLGDGAEVPLPDFEPEPALEPVTGPPGVPASLGAAVFGMGILILP